jgi:hypothetical protein
LPVIAATDFTWPTFSATRTSTTGTNSPTSDHEKCGVVNSGSPNHFALSTVVKSREPKVLQPMTFPPSHVTRYPTTTPTRIDSRPRMPRKKTVTSRIVPSVIVAVEGATW